MISVQDLMENPPPKEINWKLWSRKWSKEEKQLINILLNKVAPELRCHGILFEITVQPVGETRH
jgi:hypothetical protein